MGREIFAEKATIGLLFLRSSLGKNKFGEKSKTTKKKNRRAERTQTMKEQKRETEIRRVITSGTREQNEGNQARWCNEAAPAGWY